MVLTAHDNYSTVSSAKLHTQSAQAVPVKVKASVVVRTLNEARYLEELLQGN